MSLIRGGSCCIMRVTDKERLFSLSLSAGDHVKFGFPLAFAQTLLCWGAINFQDGFEWAGQINYLKDNLRWGADYLMQAHTAPNELIAQVMSRDGHFWKINQAKKSQKKALKSMKKSIKYKKTAKNANSFFPRSFIAWQACKDWKQLYDIVWH